MAGSGLALVLQRRWRSWLPRAAFLQQRGVDGAMVVLLMTIRANVCLGHHGGANGGIHAKAPNSTMVVSGW